MKEIIEESFCETKKSLSKAHAQDSKYADLSSRIYKSERNYAAKGRKKQARNEDPLRRDEYVYMIVDGYGKNRVRKVIPEAELDKVVPKYLRKEYLKATIKLLNKNISAIETFQRDYKELSFENIKALMSKRFHRFPEELFFDSNIITDNWEAEPYEQSDYKAEERKHYTTRGLKVRSKSEAAIAELLYLLEVPFHYEEVLRVGGIAYIPDFTIKAPDGSFWYLEHCGLTSNPAYMEHHYKKLTSYAKAGIVPWKNLIVTYEDENGGLDLHLIKKEIAAKIKARNV